MSARETKRREKGSGKFRQLGFSWALEWECCRVVERAGATLKRGKVRKGSRAEKLTPVGRMFDCNLNYRIVAISLEMCRSSYYY